MNIRTLLIIFVAVAIGFAWQRRAQAQTLPRPSLSVPVVAAANRIEMSWPGSASNFVLEGSDSLGATANWQAVSDAYGRLKAAELSHNPAEHDAAMKQLGQAITDGQSERGRWREIRETLEQRRRIMETIAKQQFLGQRYIKADELWEVYRRLALAVQTRFLLPGRRSVSATSGKTTPSCGPNTRTRCARSWTG